MATKKTISVKREELKDVTKERINYVAKCYRDSIEKILTDGKVYIVKFAEGYTVDGKKEAEANNITRICFLSWKATDEKVKKEYGPDAKPGTQGRVLVESK